MKIIGDRLFVALAKRVGHPTRSALRSCQELQRRGVEAGKPVTLFSLSCLNGIIKPASAAGFVILAENVIRSRLDYADQLFDDRPLEASIEDGLLSDSCPEEDPQLLPDDVLPDREPVDRDSREWNTLLDDLEESDMISSVDASSFRERSSGWDVLIQGLERDGLIPSNHKSTVDQTSGEVRALMRVPHARSSPYRRARAGESARARPGNGTTGYQQHGPPGPGAGISSATGQ